MLLSKNTYNDIVDKLTQIVVDKVQSKENVDWQNQFKMTKGVFDTLYGNLKEADKSLVEQYRQVMVASLSTEKRKALIDYCEDTNKVMSFLYGRLGGVVHFMASHNDGTIRTSAAQEKFEFDSIYKRGVREYWFDYCRELVGLERLLNFTKESYIERENSCME